MKDFLIAFGFVIAALAAIAITTFYLGEKMIWVFAAIFSIGLLFVITLFVTSLLGSKGNK